MGYGQVEIVYNARELEDVYSDAQVDSKVKEKLKLIEAIREFAFDSIGLKRNDNYTTYYDQKGKRLLYVVTASKPFELVPYEWSFPIIGDVPYKGFFVEEKANAERDRLKAEGWDTDIGGASGWSTLGWFRDPVLSNMLETDEGDLAELIIHELTHGTIYVNGDANYNENLATFIGVNGAAWYLTSRYGKDSKQYQDYLHANSEDDIRTQFMLSSAVYLDSIYKAIKTSCNENCKHQIKQTAFDTIVARAEALGLANDSLFHVRIEKRLNESGNAVFLHYTRYSGKQTDFMDDFKKVQFNLRRFIEEIMERIQI